MGKNWAIAIGINQYRYLQPLQYAVRDAAAMHDYFTRELGFERVYAFTDNSPPIPQDYGPALDSVPLFAVPRALFSTRTGGWGFIWRVEEESRLAPVMRVTASKNQPELGSLVSCAERLPNSPLQGCQLA